MAGDVHVIVFQEDDLAGKAWLLAKLIDAPDQGLAGFIARMRLAGKDELHGPLRIVEDALESFRILENERGPFVGGKATGEAERQCIWIEDLRGLGHASRALTPPQILLL